MVKPCTLGKRHKWSFVCNKVKTTQMGRNVSIRQVGIYKCECGQKKIGDYGINEVAQ